MRTNKLSFLIILAALALQACGGPSTADVLATGVAQTVQISQLETAAAQGNQQQATAAVVATQAAAETATPMPTATSSIPFVSVSVNTNCRTGPSANYGYVTTINVGQQVEVLKVFNTANYVVVRNPAGGGDCWLWLQYATPANFAQYDLPVATQPPTPTPSATPTPTYDWSGNWSNKTTNGSDTYTGTINFSIAGNTLTGTTTWGAYNYTFTGTLSADKQQVSGTWNSTLGTNGPWTATLKTDNTNQFIGNIGSGWAFCGWRGGAGEPNPCNWP